MRVVRYRWLNYVIRGIKEQGGPAYAGMEKDLESMKQTNKSKTTNTVYIANPFV